MDLLDILRSRVEQLPPGDYTIGLRAVLLHVQVASNHLQRGQTQSEDTAFTDVIYRTNQAFEGSLKEAYRVLARQDPAKKTPSDIENYLQQNNVLRDRVLAQLTSYRRDWRNPSTHDYRLDFDEDEALLAIVSVCAFAVVLTDQIAERVRFENARSAPQSAPAPPTVGASLADRITEALLGFRYDSTTAGSSEALIPREVELVGSLAGYLTTALPDVQVEVEARASTDTHERVDILVKSDTVVVPVEVKRSRAAFSSSLHVAPLLHYMNLLDVSVGILYLFAADQPQAPMQRQDMVVQGTDEKVIIIRAPQTSAPA